MLTPSRSTVMYLARRAWEHARGQRGRMVLYLSLFLVAQGFHFAQPYVVGRLLNTVQSHSASANLSHEITLCALWYFAIELAFWLFHGPARVIERSVAFQVRAHYKTALFDLGTQLPLQWHRD